MAGKDQDRIVSVYLLEPKSGEIRRKRMLGEQLVDEVVAAKYDAEKQIVTFKNAKAVKDFKESVITFLAENELLVKSFQRADVEPDKPLHDKSVPQRPRKTNHEGDKTPAVIDWYYKFRPNEFKTRYGYLGTYSGVVRFQLPQWEPRPVDGIPEYRGTRWETKDVTNVMVTLRKTHLSFTPDECVGDENRNIPGWSEDDPEAEEPQAALPNVRAGGKPVKGGDEE
jgi:hypothetical protein